MPSILYAEDDRDCRKLFTFMLRQQGHKVHEATNGAQVVQLVREETIDLVILDVRMPMVTGYEVARIMARETPSIPIVFLSAKGLRPEIVMAFECSPMVVDYVVKPVLPDEFVAWIEDILRGCQVRGMKEIRETNMARELIPG